MKRITPTQARKDWFRLLDEVAAGEVVVLERNGHRIRIQRETNRVSEPQVPAYGKLLKVADADHADEWTWEWRGPGKKLAHQSRRAP